MRALANNKGERRRRTGIGACKCGFLSLLLLACLITSSTRAVAADHPFLILQQSDFAVVAARINSETWRPLRNRAADRWDDDSWFSSFDSNWNEMASQLSYLMMMSLADPGNGAAYKNKLVDVLGRWPALRSRLGTDHSNAVNPTSALFNSIIALDLFYNQLSTAQRSKIQTDIQSIIDWYDETDLPWRLAPLGILTLWAVYREDAVDIARHMAAYNEYLMQASMMSDGSWNQSPGYLSARVAGHRLAKSHTIDVLQFTGHFDFYNNRQMRDFVEWMGSFAFTPFGGNTCFGDTGSIVTNNIANDNLLFRTERYGERAGGIGSWLLDRRYVEDYGRPMPWTRDHANFLTLVMMPSQRPAPQMPRSLLKPFSGAALWDRTDSSEALSAVLYSLRRESSLDGAHGHAHQDTNSVDLNAYGEHILANSGVDYVGRDGQGFDWPGYTPDNGRWYPAYMQNSVLIGDRNEHVENEGGGLISGVVGGSIEFGTTGSLNALGNGVHDRTLYLVHPVNANRSGYFALVDEVRADNAGAIVRVNLHPNTQSGVTTEQNNTHYRASIDGLNQKNYDGSESVDIFFGTPPAAVSVKQAWKGDFNLDPLKSDYLEARYATNGQRLAYAATVIFPSDQLHPRASLSRIATGGFSGVRVTHPDSARDVLLASAGSSEHEYNGLRFQAKSLLYSADASGAISAYAVASGRRFIGSGQNKLGFDSAAPVSVQMDAAAGHIQTSGGEITFVSPSVTGVRVNGREADVIARGTDSVRIALPSGRHRIELTDDPLQPSPQVGAQPVTVSEGAGIASVRITLSQASTSPVSVLVATLRDSAINGQDFYGLTQTVRFAPGDRQKTVNIRLLDDGIVEGTESFRLRLIEAEGASIDTPGVTVTITDNDLDTRPTLSVSNIRVNESVGNALVTVRLQPESSTPVTVDIATAALTARPGVDYWGTYRSLRFAAGVSELRVPVTILDDSAVEPAETLLFRLFGVVGNAGVGNETATIEIVDDD